MIRSDSGKGEAYADEEVASGSTLLVVDIERANAEVRSSCTCFEDSVSVGGTLLDKDRRLSAAVGNNCREEDAILRLANDRADAMAMADEAEGTFILSAAGPSYGDGD